MPDADLKQPLSSAPTVSESFTGNHLTSLHDMEPGLTSNPSTPPIFFFVLPHFSFIFGKG